MHRTLIGCLAVALAATSASSQVDPRKFAPRDYTAELRVDMAAVVDSGLWDLVERSPLRMLLVRFRDRMGFDLADLDEVRLMQRVDPPADGAEARQQVREQVWILKGGEHVGASRLSEAIRQEYPVVGKVAGVEIRRGEHGNRELTSPASGVLVMASILDWVDESQREEAPRGLVARTLAGERMGGTPVPDLMALTASPHALAVLAAVASEGMPLGPDSMEPFPDAWFVAEDRPQGFRLQIVRIGDAGHTAIEMLLRYANADGKGARALADGFAATRAALAEDHRLKPLATALESVETSIDGRDLTLRLDLGTERQVGAKLTPLLLGTVGWVTLGEQVEETVTVEVEPEPAPQKRK